MSFRTLAFSPTTATIALLTVTLSARSPTFAAEFTVETILDGLHQPCGLALRPGGGADRFELYIAETGAGRVSSWKNAESDKSATAIEGFEAAADSNATTALPRMSLAFLDPGLLVVGATVENNPARVWNFELPDEPKVLTPQDSRGQVASTSDQLTSRSAFVTAISRTRANEHVPDMLVYVVRNRDRGRLYRSKVQAGLIEAMAEFNADGKDNSPSSVSAVTTSPTGRIVAVTGTGDSASSQLSFYNPASADVELEMPLDLPDVVALAYEPANGGLYAADYSAGVYRIDDASRPGHPACRAVKIADVPHPTALAFAPDGSLYVTSAGGGANDGSLQVVTGKL